MLGKALALASAGNAAEDPAWQLTAPYPTVQASEVGQIDNLRYIQGFSVAAQDTTPAGIFFHPDGNIMFVGGASGRDINVYTLSKSWDVTTATYSTAFFHGVSGGGFGLFFDSGGTHMYITAGFNIRQYDLSIAWDVSTASLINNLSFASPYGQPYSIFFKSDGAKMYLVASASDAVVEYDLSTAWDISTASYNQHITTTTEDTDPIGVAFNSDGTVMYVTGNTNNSIYQYNLSAAWDVNTKSYIQSFSVTGQETAPYGIFVKPGNNVFYILGTGSDTVRQYEIVVPFFFGGTDNGALGKPWFKPDGTKMYITGSQYDSVHEFDLSVAWDVTTASYSQSFSTAAQTTTPYSVNFKSDGTKFYIASGTSVVFEYSLGTAWDISTASYTASFNASAQMTSGNLRSLYVKPDGTKFYGLAGGALGRFYVWQYSLSTPWDITTASYDSKSFYAHGVDTSAYGLFFHIEGEKLYLVGITGRRIYELDLTTAWDVSTASLTQSFYLNSYDTSPRDVFFKPDGFQFFITGNTGDNIIPFSIPE